jgi:hypothetical protein
MRRALLLGLIAALVAVGGAGADGGAPTYVLLGGKGVLSPDGSVRYVALTTGRQTVVSVVRVRGGQVVRWRLVPGYFGVPVVALDGTTAGISEDGRTLVLADAPGGRMTDFAVIDTRTLRLRRVELRGSWSYDAISPDGSTLFLVEYLGTTADPPYRVRVFDLGAWRLLARPLVDRREREAVMRGRPVTRVSSRNGRWAYTLYARAQDEPFVHALDTVRRSAFCIDLPLELHLGEQTGLRLALRARGRLLVVRAGERSVAVIDTRTLRLRSR